MVYHGLAGVATARVGRTHLCLSVRENVAAIGRSDSRVGGQECSQTCAFRKVTEYISASQSTAWDLTKDHLFPLVLADGSKGAVPMPAQRMTAALQGHLRMGGLPDHFTMHSFRASAWGAQ